MKKILIALVCAVTFATAGVNDYKWEQIITVQSPFITIDSTFNIKSYEFDTTYTFTADSNNLYVNVGNANMLVPYKIENDYMKIFYNNEWKELKGTKKYSILIK